MEIKEIEKLKKNFPVFYCESCDFKCFQKCDWERHILRDKHNNRLEGNAGNEKKLEKTFTCKCGKFFKTNAGLWKHKKNCTEQLSKLVHLEESNKDESKKDNPSDKELIMMLIKENSELRKEQSDIKELILEIVKNGTHNTNTNNSHNTTNSHNKAFNLNLFLNETCKNAMNINDFVDSIKLQLSDFIDVGEKGFVQGISNIIVKKLNSLDETVRPIHCTDQKRETFYVKDENKWEKEEEDMKKIRKMIKRVVVKNEKLMTVYKEKFPDYDDYYSNRSDQYSKFVIEAMGGFGDNDVEKENKIIKNVSKVTLIKKFNAKMNT
jgi:hypothetical protein